MVERVSIALKTKDRSPNRNFALATLENLHRAGAFSSPHFAGLSVVVSSRSVGYLAGAVVEPALFDVADRTLHQNAQRSIQRASEVDAEWAMVLEDDLDFVDCFLESVVAWLRDQDVCPMYALGANYSQIETAVERGRSSWEYPVGAFYGAQALVWRREDAAQLADWLGPDPFYPGRHGQEVRDHGHDLLLQRWGRERGREYFIASAPSMVQHVGAASGIGNRFFQFQSFPGPGWRYRPRAGG